MENNIQPLMSAAAVARKRRRDIIQCQKKHQTVSCGTTTGTNNDINNGTSTSNRSENIQMVSLVSSASSTSSSDDESNATKKTQTVASVSYYPSSVSLPLPPKKRKVSLEVFAIPTKINQQSKNKNSHIAISVVDNAGKASNAGNSHTKSTKQTKQKRYDPETKEKLSKEQLAAWRKEARKVRNRQSAAASREKIRNRIGVLELEVEEWKTKYQQLAIYLNMIENR